MKRGENSIGEKKRNAKSRVAVFFGFHFLLGERRKSAFKRTCFRKEKRTPPEEREYLFFSC
jgi:hypothetical protein